MSVYVDEARWPYRHMMMCHMIADTKEELLEMVDKIGVPRKWIQKEGRYDEHFDICKSKRELAIKFGAIPVTSRQLILLMKPPRALRDLILETDE